MKKIKLLVLLAVGSLVSVSCSDDDVTPIGGGDTAIVGFPQTVVNSNVVTDGLVQPYMVPINVIGGNQALASESDISVTYEFVAAASTATEGVEFDITAASNTLVIPAGSLSTVIPLDIYSENIVVGDNKTLVFDITTVTSANNVVIGTNFQRVTITLIGLCFSDLAGQYYWNYTTGPAYFNVVQESPGVYNAGQFPFFLAIYEFSFTDVCDQLTMTDWEFQSGNPLYGTSTPMPVGTVLPNGNLAWTGINVTGTTVIDRNITAYRVP